MSTKLGRQRSRVNRLPHPSWNLDQPVMFPAGHDAAGEPRAAERRKVTPEEIWALVDAAN